MKEEGSMNGPATMKYWWRGVSSKDLYLLRMEEVRENNQIKKGKAQKKTKTEIDN